MPDPKKDIDLLQQLEAAKKTGDLSGFTDEELMRLAQIKKLLPPSHGLSKDQLSPFSLTGEPVVNREASGALLKKADQMGAPEILGGATGAVLGAGAGGIGAVPGRVLGSGLSRYVVERAKGHDTGEAGLAGGLSGAIDAIFGGGGKLLERAGLGAMHGALPITEKEALAAGGYNELAKHKGADKLVEEMLREPGMTPRRAYAAVEAIMARARGEATAARAAADAHNIKINPNDVASKAEQRIQNDIRGGIHSPGQLSGAESVIEQFLENRGARDITRTVPLDLKSGEIGGRKITTRVPALDIGAQEAQDILNKTPFVSGASEVAGVKEGVRTLRQELSSALKDAVPGVIDPMKVQSENIPKMEILDRLILNDTAAPTGEVLVRNIKPQIFGIIPAAPSIKFTTGKLMERTGRMAPNALSLVRVIEGLLNNEDQ